MQDMYDTPVSAGNQPNFKFTYAYPYETDPYITGAAKFLGKPRDSVTHNERSRFKEVFFDTYGFRLDQPLVENASYPVKAWAIAVSNGKTLLSYRDWSDQLASLSADYTAQLEEDRREEEAERLRGLR